MSDKSLIYEQSLFGIRINSDIALPELNKASQFDVGSIAIRRGNVTESPLTKAKQFGPFIHANPSGILVSLPNIVAFIARQGEELIYQPSKGVDENSIRLYLFGSGMAAIMMQRGFLVLHGNALETTTGCLICVGSSGAGKSTSAAAMLQRGHKIVADDVCAINKDGYAIPGLPRIKLWQESADILGIDTSQYQRIRPDLEKFNIPLGSNYSANPRRVEAIVNLETNSEEAVKSEQILGKEKISLIRQNNFRPRFVSALDQPVLNFKQVGSLAQSSSVYRLSRPKSGNHIDSISECLEKIGRFNRLHT